MNRRTAQYVLALMMIALCGDVEASVWSPKDSGAAPTRGRSTGCGTIHAGTGTFVPMEIRVFDQVRTYHLRVPSSYNPMRAYPLIFRWHGYGGDGTSGGLDIEYSAGNDAIVVGADGIDKYWNPSADSANLRLFDLMLDTIEKQYCIDRDRVFSYGFSAGGFFSNVLACERGDVLRANAVVAGGLKGGYRRRKISTWLLDVFGTNDVVTGSGHCRGRVATWLLHDQDDRTVPIATGKAARERALELNGCSTNTIDDGDGCVRYHGCDAAPVVWCETRGFGHNIRGEFAPPRVWKFFHDLH